MSLSRRIWLAVELVCIPVLIFLVWAIIHIFASGHTWPRGFHLWFDRWYGVNGAMRWLTVGLISLGGLVIVATKPRKSRYIEKEGKYKRNPFTKEQFLAGTWLLAIFLLACVLWFTAIWDNDKDAGRFYNRATTFYVPNLKNPPPSLKNLLAGARDGNGTSCDKIGSADVESCIKQGTLTSEGWEPRVSSLGGAITVMERTSGQQQNVNLRTDTIAYLNAWHGKPAVWTAVRDGSGLRQPMEGVVEWTGTGLPTECTFSGKYAINRALEGGKLNSMKNLIATKYAPLFYHLYDAWGYCDGDQPIVVIPMLQQVHFKMQTEITPGGVLVVQGSPSGQPRFTYKSAVKAGQFPGPVYPISLAGVQREASSWAAGREFRSRSSFGYEPANSEAQGGNNSEYLLRSTKDGRMYYVTPETPRGSSSELFVAYAVVAADTVERGQLNPLGIYTLDQHDPRIINIDNLEANAKNFVQTQDPGFFPAGGKLVEFTPIDGDIWRAFGEFKGRVTYRLDISYSSKIQPRLVQLAGTGNDAKNAVGTAVCGKPLGELSQQDLATCIQQFAGELGGRVPASK